MLANSCTSSMSQLPGGGHVRLWSMSQIPDMSGLPSVARGACALRFTLPSEVLGTPAVGNFNHCADNVAEATHTRDPTRAAIFTVTSGLEPPYYYGNPRRR